MPAARTRKFVAAIAALFTVLILVILGLAIYGVITGPMALLMFVALFAIYIGGGVLIAVYRFVERLE